MANEHTDDSVSGINLEITQEDYAEYVAREDIISNERIRPDDMTFLSALTSVKMADDPGGKRIIDIIRKL